MQKSVWVISQKSPQGLIFFAYSEKEIIDCSEYIATMGRFLQ